MERKKKNNIDSNAVVSIFGKTNAITKLLYDAVKNESNGNVSMFYWNKKEASALLQSAGLQLPSVLPQDGFINSIRNKNANVNIRFENQIETQQFKRWFGDWQNGKVNKALLNADGTPLVLYHQTGNEFTVFSEKSTGAGQYDSEMPDGIFMKPNNNDIGISWIIVNTLDTKIRTKSINFHNRLAKVRYCVNEGVPLSMYLNRLSTNSCVFEYVRRSVSSFFMYLKKHSITALSYGCYFLEKDCIISNTSNGFRKPLDVNWHSLSV